MFKNLYNRLLTHYPLLWNTRVVWVIGALLIIHFFFFLAGFTDISAFSLQQYYSLDNVITGNLMSFSVLCSLAVIIIWLIFYLRNNAYKSFYIIDKYHSVKEFFIIILIILVTIIFFESYKWGAWLKTRTITGKEQLVKEANIVNLARAFIPGEKGDYFKLIDCDNGAGRPANYSDGVNYFDTARSDYNDSNAVKIRKALQEKDVFSYKNYCNEFIKLDEYKGFIPASQWREKKNRWIDDRNTDSIRHILEECIIVCRKYNIEQHIDPEAMANLVFADSFHNVTRLFGRRYSDYDNSRVDYFDDYSLGRVLRFIDDCQLNSTGNNDRIEIFTVEMYIALCLSILLFCYRLYNKKVFLISVVGTIVWCILFALFAASSGSDGISWFYLFLFALFLFLAIISLNSGDNKTATGVLLNWHIFMLPFVLMIIIFLIQDDYQKHHFYINYQPIPDEILKKRYPIGHWVDNHTGLLIRLNLLLVLLYTAFFFTRLSKKWHITPEE